MPFELQANWVGEVVVVRCRGRLVAGEDVRALHAEVERLMKETKQIVLQMEEVSGMDSSGLGVIIRLLGALRAAHGDLKLCMLSPQLGQVFNITNLLGVAQICESEEEAIQAFSAQTRPAGEKPGEPKMKILCVDDSNDVLACLRVLLQREGYEVHTTSNLFDAATLSKAVRPGLVILGPKVRTTSQELPASVFTRVDPMVQLLQLDSGFSTAEAGQAGADLVACVRSLLTASRS